jgi:hypothetical protein
MRFLIQQYGGGVTADPTILPRRALERQARMHQWLQDVPDLTPLPPGSTRFGWPVGLPPGSDADASSRFLISLPAPLDSLLPQAPPRNPSATYTRLARS